MEKVSKAVLRYLFHQYVKGPSVHYSINTITDEYKADPIAVSDFMLDRQWIREPWTHQNNVVTCRIAVLGIEEINPLFVHNRIKSLVAGLVAAGGRKNLSEIFQNNIGEYAIALDIVGQLERLQLVTIGHEGGTIDVALTEEGWNYLDKGGKQLFSLMAVA